MNLKYTRYILIFIIAFCVAGNDAFSENSPVNSHRIHMDKGFDFLEKGDFEKAAQYWEAAAGLLKDKKTLSLYTDIVIRLAHARQALGDYSGALSVLQKHLSHADEINNQRQKALFFNRLGNMWLSAGSIEQSIYYLLKAEDIAIEAKDSYALASIMNNIGNTLVRKGDNHDAEAAYSECLDVIKMAENAENINFLPDLKSSVLINLFRIKKQNSRQKDELIALKNKAAIAVNQLPDSHIKAANLVSLALAVRVYSINETMQLLEKAEQIADKLDDFRVRANASGYLGQIFELKSNLPKALALSRKAVFFAQQGNSPEILYYWQRQMGRIFNTLGKTKEAISAYKESVNTLTPVRTRLISQKNVFQSKIKPVYLELAGLLLKEAENIERGIEQEKQLRQASQILDLLKTVELQEFFQDECVADRLNTTSVEEQITPGAAVIYPIPFPDSLVLLVIMKNQIRQIRVPVSSSQLEGIVKRFRRQLQYGLKEEFLKDAIQLYSWLISPVEKFLTSEKPNEKPNEKIDTLIIAPDGVLRLIPFSALHNGKNFLIESYALCVVPALTLTEFKPEFNQGEKQDLQILLEGLSQARQGFSPLPNVKKELQGIMELMGGRVLLDENYTIENFKKELKAEHYSIVHMATHGVFGSNAAETFLLTHDGKLTMDLIEQIFSQTREQGKTVDLLTLSACQTALGDERAAFGLAGIAVKAGVTSAIATLWSVEDEAASLIMGEFYKELKLAGMTKAKAMQNAQKQLISQNRYRHPAFWASFLLIGNWM
ncbi:CHAT domain-containing protein [Desulfobacterales bacterium HSG17]|nr:CHAT domain-containing protein [Desulfobacterales bacterium HSG17]